MSIEHDGGTGAGADAPVFLPEGAFVVQFKTSTLAAATALAGRVEHVVSGQAIHFQSPAELLAFLHAVLRPYVQQDQTRARPSLAGSYNKPTSRNA